MRACKLDGAFGGDPSSKSSSTSDGGLHLVVTEVVPVGGGGLTFGEKTPRLSW